VPHRRGPIELGIAANYSLGIIWDSQRRRVMAKKAAEPKPAATQPEDRFVELMLLAAEFVKSAGGLEQAKKSLAETGQFIKSAGGVASAEKALSVLESLKDKIG
jgi:hypothetical protein